MGRICGYSASAFEVSASSGWTIPLTIAISYFVMGGEGIAHYIEEPFGHHEDHLDLPGICQGIKASVSEILSSANPV